MYNTLLLVHKDHRIQTSHIYAQPTKRAAFFSIIPFIFQTNQSVGYSV